MSVTSTVSASLQPNTSTQSLKNNKITKSKKNTSFENDTTTSQESKTAFNKEEAKRLQEEALEKQLKESIEKARLERLAIQKAFRNKKKISFNPVSELGKIASATTAGQVTTIVSRIRSQYISITRSLGYGNGKANENQLRQLQAVMRKVIRKGSAKIHNLEDEDRMEAKRKLAQKAKEIERELALKLELERKRKNRKVQESNDILEAKRDALHNRYYDDTYTITLDLSMQTIPQDPILPDSTIDATSAPADIGIDTSGTSGAGLDMMM